MNCSINARSEHVKHSEIRNSIGPGVGVMTHKEYVEGVRVCFDLLKCHVLSFITFVVRLLCKFHIIKKDERHVSKTEGKSNFRGA